MPDRPFFDERDTQIARRYVEEKYQPGAFDPVNEEGAEQPDLVAIASIASTRGYLRHSEQTISKAGKPFRAFPAFVSTIVPNAFAASRDGLHICGLHVGLFAMVHEICFLTMGQQACFTAIGDPARERSPRYEIGDFPAFWLIDQTVNDAEFSKHALTTGLVPQCQERYLFGVHLTLLMLRFVWFHEQAHCINGHVDYLATFNKDIRLNEVADPSLSFVELDTAPLPLPWQR